MNPQILHSQKFTFTDNGTSDPANVSAADFQNIAIIATGSDTADFSIRVKGSVQLEVPDFESPSTIDNSWSYIQLKNDINQSYLNGDTGYTFGANQTVAFELNTSLLTWVAVEVFNYVSGTLEAKFTFKNNI